MYDRAPRVLSRPYGSTAPGVGPGTYHTAKKTNGGMPRINNINIKIETGIGYVILLHSVVKIILSS